MLPEFEESNQHEGLPLRGLVDSVDSQAFYDEAWLDFRKALAELLMTGFTLLDYLPRHTFNHTRESFDPFAGAGERIDLVNRDGRILWVAVVDDGIIMFEQPDAESRLIEPEVPDELRQFAVNNVDEAAFVASRILREVWGLQHPALLKSNHHPGLVDRANYKDDEDLHRPGYFDLRVAQTREQLEDWVRFTLRSDGTPVELEATGDFRGATLDQNLVVVAVHSTSLVEIWSIVADGYSEETARTIATRLNSHPSPYKFVAMGAMVRMHCVLYMKPFLGEHLNRTLIAHMNDTDDLWKRIPTMDFSKPLETEYLLDLPEEYVTEVKDQEFSFPEEELKNIKHANRLAEIRLKHREFAEKRLRETQEQVKELREELRKAAKKNDLLVKANHAVSAELARVRSLIDRKH